MEIIKTKPGNPDFHLFENLPNLLYGAESIRHKELEYINSEFLVSGYVLLVKGEAKARVALYNNPHLIYNGKNSACLGNYESVADANISSDLLLFVANESKKLGADFLIGPMNGSTWDNYRFSLHHNHPNFMLEPYHHLYYNQQFLASGFNPIAKYKSSIDRDILCNQPEVLKLDNHFSDMGVQIRSININDYEEELTKLYPFISTAFQKNFLYTPASWETFFYKYKAAVKIINPEYVLIAEDSKGNIIGFIFCYEDIFNNKNRSLIVKTIARNISKQWSGLGYVMANRVVSLAQSKGYKFLIHAFMIEQGASTEVSNKFSGNTYKDYVLYGLELS